MIKIEVISSETREVIKKATGEIFKIPEVKAYVHGIDRYPVAIRFGIAKGVRACCAALRYVLPCLLRLPCWACLSAPALQGLPYRAAFFCGALCAAFQLQHPQPPQCHHSGATLVTSSQLCPLPAQSM